jgi:hypothetical protein
LERLLEHRIADRRVLRLIGKWLAAGVIEDGEWSSTEQGTAQGASVSPLLANVYLHYVFDLWADQWRRRNARGDVIFSRFADDYVAGFEHREDAERFLADLRGRFAEFGLELHPDRRCQRPPAQIPASASIRWSGSGASPTRSRASGGPAGCRSHAAPARSDNRRWIGAAAAARHCGSRATRRPRIPSAGSRRITTASSRARESAQTNEFVYRTIKRPVRS